MKILVSNDDGVFAPGLAVLAETLSALGHVQVVAPDRDLSAASNSLTVSGPLRVKYQDNGFISVEGTPTDCVHVALTGLLEEQPNIVVAGVNEGANLGDDILYSGTVAAAMEGRFLGLSAIAVSLVGSPVKHFLTAAKVAKQLVMHLEANPLSSNTILNVNVPDVPIDELKGYEVTRLGYRHCAESIVKAKDPQGKTIYWIGPAGPEADAGLGTDFHAIRQGKVSITPLQLDLTHYKIFQQVADWIDDFSNEMKKT